MGLRALTVTEFLQGVNEVLASVPALVEGEVSGYAVSQGKWAFFSLKDDASVVGCFMPVWKLRHPVEDGMCVRIAGVSRVYEKSGKFSIVVEALEPAGEGSLKRAFELLRSKLEREGLFAAERKRGIPRFPETIGLIASGDSAAYSDFLRILGNRWGGVTVLHQDVAVQGEHAIDDIVAAMQYWSTPRSPQPDVLVLVRGGGSLEDLAAFNSEAIARAVFASPIPVVVGVGHERDISIADLVADVRASTPSNAAELVVPDRRDVAHAVDALLQRMDAGVLGVLDRRRTGLARFVGRGAAFAAQRRARVDASAAALVARAIATCARFRERIRAADRLISNLSPHRLIARGYSMTFVHGRLVRTTRGLRAGDVLATRVQDGEITSIIRD